MNTEHLVNTLQFAAFFWGAAWGSFLNVVIYRLPEGLSVVRPGSHCPSCKSPVRWYDNIPCLSYFILRGRCRSCEAPFSVRYALIEIICGLLCLALFRSTVLPLSEETLYSGFGTWIWLQVFVFGLIAITFIDLKHLFIPDEISISAMVIGVAGAYLLPTVDGHTAALGLVVGLGFMLSVAGLGWLVYRREALGLGDAKLMGMIGAFLGWRALPFVLFASAVQALLAVGATRVWTRITGSESDLTLTTDELDAHFGEEDRYADAELEPRLVVPYGPFLALAALEALFFGSDSIWWLAEWLADKLIGGL
jgi:leader peptidase (prepilin peptidase) / N-methyltransferase